jgi:hypothetical protein
MPTTSSVKNMHHQQYELNNPKLLTSKEGLICNPPSLATVATDNDVLRVASDN